jgi:hypothetical protein
MRPEDQVLVTRDGTTVPGLILKWRKTGQQALVTYEVDGRVATEWVRAEDVLPLTDPPRATATVSD